MDTEIKWRNIVKNTYKVTPQKRKTTSSLATVCTSGMKMIYFKSDSTVNLKTITIDD